MQGARLYLGSDIDVFLLTYAFQSEQHAYYVDCLTRPGNSMLDYEHTHPASVVPFSSTTRSMRPWSASSTLRTADSLAELLVSRLVEASIVSSRRMVTYHSSWVYPTRQYERMRGRSHPAPANITFMLRAPQRTSVRRLVYITGTASDAWIDFGNEVTTVAHIGLNINIKTLSLTLRRVHRRDAKQTLRLICNHRDINVTDELLGHGFKTTHYRHIHDYPTEYTLVGQGSIIEEYYIESLW